MNTPPYTPQTSTPQYAPTHRNDTSLNHELIITHLIDAIILRSWALDDDLAHALERVLTTVTGENQKTQDRFDAAVVEIQLTNEDNYRWISLMKVGEALGLVPFVPDFAVHQARLREVWRAMYGRDLELALKSGVVDLARRALGEGYE
ncbi:hypothetical protein CLAFUW4_03038 [Fulvia fulva]|uniref:Uncharacterized protein n=1 Tax=Passalora fulva TaxID=5499 RepID=A0A9Q8P5N6_PASFU|nr:uncharacterized protein CLAFUR5_03022 [Fulvia fulva]KAK4631639.1 hypothetical protein CLAFUR4_03031 [Fulvia fulva]KAK4632728.1 hypothetical protein CLAFUR0_03034 [Fulvia fulva]UJO14310.1 hypothetical protein CLAFUR5_03022 [Fulvia fulva]WPV11493.1 hypothetical protein CLAFUW4_03038 [Fulvia fulva]WPV26378.1 hypothetical protein CLAFUW7_03035 [Fulvia fulva]